MSKYNLIPNNWTPYAGNKMPIIEEVLDFIPKRTDAIVDVFGGTGFVAANAYHAGLVKEAIVNEFEFDQAELLAFLADNRPEDIIEYAKKAEKHWFKGEDRINDENKSNWYALIDYYNKHKERFDETPKQYEARKAEAEAGANLIKSRMLTEEEWSEAKKRSNPYLLLFIVMRNCYMSMPRWKDNGRILEAVPGYRK